MIGETYEDLEDCRKEAFKEAAVDYHPAFGNQVLIYKDEAGKFYHTSLMSQSTTLITDDKLISNVESYNPYDELDTPDDDDEQLSWDDAIELSYTNWLERQ